MRLGKDRAVFISVAAAWHLWRTQSARVDAHERAMKRVGGGKSMNIHDAM
jgi:hypothetical protein